MHWFPQAAGQAGGTQQPPVHETEQPHEALQFTPLSHPALQSTVQSPAPQVIFPLQELFSQLTLQAPEPHVIVPVQDWDPQMMVTFLALEQSMAPWQPPLPQEICTFQPTGQVHPLAQGSWQVPPTQLLHAAGQDDVVSSCSRSSGGRSGQLSNADGPSGCARSGPASAAGASPGRSRLASRRLPSTIPVASAAASAVVSLQIPATHLPWLQVLPMQQGSPTRPQPKTSAPWSPIKPLSMSTRQPATTSGVVRSSSQHTNCRRAMVRLYSIPARETRMDSAAGVIGTSR